MAKWETDSSTCKVEDNCRMSEVNLYNMIICVDTLNSDSKGNYVK